jgi:probable F420-dependent oxidoreductase
MSTDERNPVSSTSFGIAVPQHVGRDGFDRRAFAAFLARAEALGFASGWVGEQVLGDAPDLGPVEALTFAAACTERMRLGCATFVSSLVSPLHLAKSLASLDQLSGGRLEVGLSTGGGFRQFAAFGVDRATFVARFDECLTVMRLLWSQDRVDFDGRFWQLAGASVAPRPVQQPAPPIWFGGAHPNVLRRAVAQADGFFGAGSQPTARFVEQVATLRSALAAAGRDPATMRVAKRVYVTVDDDAARGRERMSAALHRIYSYYLGDDLIDVAVVGGPDAVVAGLREVVAAGAELVVLNPLFDDHEQLERLAAEVLPHL